MRQLLKNFERLQKPSFLGFAAASIMHVFAADVTRPLQASYALAALSADHVVVFHWLRKI